MKKYTDVVAQAADLHKAGKLLEAATLYENLLGNQPDDPIVLYMYGTLCSQSKHYGTAIVFLQKAASLEPTALPEIWHNLGVVYRNEGHTELSRECYRECLRLKPNDPNVLAMLAGSYVNTGTPGLAIDYARRALAIEDNPHASNHLALGLLELGRYEEAWPHYEKRYELTGYITARPFTCPRWKLGEHVKKLAIHGEQGLGDEIMFMSCLEEVASYADEVVVECAPRLVPLFQHNWPSVRFYGTYDELAAAEDNIDAYIPMGSLPIGIRNSSKDFDGLPYLYPDEYRVQEMIKKLEKMGAGPFVGIAWHGGTKATHQELRNPPIEMFKKVIDQIRELGGTPISLQYGPDGAEQAVELGLPHWKYAIDDMPGQAALIAALDLVITPCQTAVHIAGAVGTECWCLTPSQPAWRYKVEGVMDWYQSVELIRQVGTDWETVFATVEEKLDANYRSIPAAESTAA
jgi:tetratricopeptide (TPR) repeat protein